MEFGRSNTVPFSEPRLWVTITFYFLSEDARSLIAHYYAISSVQFSRSVVSDSLRPHEIQHARPPCPSPTPEVYPNPCPSSRWCHPTISSFVVPFSCPQSLPASGSFPMSQLFAWVGQSTGVSASASVLPMNTQDLSPLGWHRWPQIAGDKPRWKGGSQPSTLRAWTREPGQV